MGMVNTQSVTDELGQTLVAERFNRKKLRAWYDTRRASAEFEPEWIISEFEGLFNSNKPVWKVDGAFFKNFPFGWRWSEDFFKVGTLSWLIMGRGEDKNIISKGSNGVVVLKREINMALFEKGFRLLAKLQDQDPDEFVESLGQTMYGAYKIDDPAFGVNACFSLSDCMKCIDMEVRYI